MLNHIVIMGRLTRDPELRRTGTGTAVTSFSVAVDRDYSPKDGGERETDFIDCVAWRSTGEFVSKYFSKGSMIVVSGRLQVRSYTDKDGNKRRVAEIVADNVYFGESKRNDQQSGGYNGGNSYGGGYNASSAPSYGGYGAQTPNYGGNSAPSYGNFSAPAPAPSYGNYTAPAAAPASDFAMLEDDDAQLPF